MYTKISYKMTEKCKINSKDKENREREQNSKTGRGRCKTNKQKEERTLHTELQESSYILNIGIEFNSLKTS